MSRSDLKMFIEFDLRTDWDRQFHFRPNRMSKFYKPGSCETKECITEASRLIIAIFQHLFGYVTIIGMPKSKSKETDKELTDNS